MKLLIVTLIVLLAVLHQDFWWWDVATPVLGFLPIGLAWHILISALSGIVWWLATVYCWPGDLEDPTPVDPGGDHQSTRE